MTSSNHPFSGVNSLLVSGSVHFNLISLILGYCVPLLMLPGEGQWHFAGRILEAFLTRWDLRPTGPPVPRNAVWFSYHKKAKGYLQYVFAFFFFYYLSILCLHTYFFVLHGIETGFHIQQRLLCLRFLPVQKHSFREERTAARCASSVPGTSVEKGVIVWFLDILGGGFKYFLFSPLLGDDFQFQLDYCNIFQMGWNHQLHVFLGIEARLCKGEINAALEAANWENGRPVDSESLSDAECWSGFLHKKSGPGWIAIRPFDPLVGGYLTI